MSPQSQDPSDLRSRAAGEHSLSDLEMRLREALVMWLRWNDAHEKCTERLFCEHCDPRQTEELLDQLDGLRHEAVRLSHELLD